VKGSSPSNPVLVGLTPDDRPALDDALFLIEQLDQTATAQGHPPNERRQNVLAVMRRLVALANRPIEPAS
jgi:hypothetical protein